MAREQWPTHEEFHDPDSPWHGSDPAAWPTTDPSTTSFAVATGYGDYKLLQRSPHNPRKWGEAITADIATKEEGGYYDYDTTRYAEAYAEPSTQPKSVSLDPPRPEVYGDTPQPRVERRYRITGTDLATSSHMTETEAGAFSEHGYPVFHDAIRDLQRMEGLYGRDRVRQPGMAAADVEDSSGEGEWVPGDEKKYVSSLYTREGFSVRVPGFMSMINNRVLDETGEPLDPSNDLSPNSSRFVRKLQELGALGSEHSNRQTNDIRFRDITYDIDESSLRRYYPRNVRVPKEELEAGWQAAKEMLRPHFEEKKRARREASGGA